MTEPTADLPLASEFPAATREAWLKLVTVALKGAPFDQRLVARTYDGLRIEPLYGRSSAAVAIAGRAPAAPWQVMARVDHPDPAAANAQARDDLLNGATGLTLVFAGAVGAYGFGLAPSEAAIGRVLDGIHLDFGLTIELDFGASAADAPRLIADLVKRAGVPPHQADIRFGLDPLGAIAVDGGSALTWPELAPRFAAQVAELAGAGFKGPFAAADARAISAALGSEAQELAFALASGAAYLRALEAQGVALDEARRMIFFRLAADADQFLNVAKFRALRRLWAGLEQACGLAPAPAFICAETAWRMMTRRDASVNMLRATMAAFAAGIGGADAVTVLPFTSALGLPDALARRIARNTQLILLEESNLAKVTDPAAGSGAIEHLTSELCGAAWSLFQEIEAAGGAASALAAGLIQRKVAEVRAVRMGAVARRTDAMTGTSEFPQLTETPATVLDVVPVRLPRGSPSFEPLPIRRLAEPFEVLREKSDRMLTTTGARPKVFLANLGPLATSSPRASFAKNFFEAGGIEAPTNDGFPEAAAMAAAFTASGARLACICSSDEIYATQAAPAARALVAAGARHVCLAGRAGEHEQALRDAGIATFIHAGCDVPATLAALYPVFGSD